MIIFFRKDFLSFVVEKNEGYKNVIVGDNIFDIIFWF